MAPAQGAATPVVTAQIKHHTTAPSRALDRSRNLGEVSSTFGLDDGWTGVTVTFNRTETIAVGAGWAGCNPVLGKLPSWVGIAFSSYCGALAIYAGTVLASGRCVKLWTSYVPALPESWTSWDC